MINSLTNKFTPRANHILYVLGVERISKESQDELSLDDQERYQAVHKAEV